MTYQPHYIASYDKESGMFTYTEPFLAPEKAFPVIEDAYCFRGRVLQKKGSTFLGRLSRKLVNADLGNISAVGPGQVVINIFSLLSITGEPNAQIQPKTSFSIAIAAPISQTITDVTGDGNLTVTPATPITAATINYLTGDVTLTYNAAAGPADATITCYYYPGFPVMGCRTQELPASNDENYIFFDQKYAYKFNPIPTMFEELVSSTPTTWHGSDSDFFWSTNYSSNTKGDLFWASNYNMSGVTRDPIYYYDTTTWTAFTPLVLSNTTLYNARIIVPYHGRLVMFNTWEGLTAGTISAAQNFSRRARWSAIGSPITATAWQTDIIGQGGYEDATTNEAIIGAEFIKDTLVVKFERSSWKFVYTGNQVEPFIWQKINTVMGSDSAFCQVPFDTAVLSISNRGITSDDSVNVDRIDLQIPQTVLNVNTDNNGLARIQGIRDFSNELVYWTFPNSIFGPDTIFPNNVLAYNYRNSTYSIFLDSYTCFGYFQRKAATWAQLPYKTWADWNDAWNSGDPPPTLEPYVVAGTQHGFVVLVSDESNSQNSDTLYVSSIFSSGPSTTRITANDHNLIDDDVIILNGFVGGLSILNGLAFTVTRIDKDTIEILYALPALAYIGLGTISKVSNFYLQTKRFAPFYEQGHQCRLGYIDFLFEYTPTGQVSVDVFVDENDSISVTDTTANPCLFGSNVVNTCPDNTSLIPFQSEQGKIWHRLSVQSIAQNFMVAIGLTPEQRMTLATYDSYITLHAIALYLSPNARLVQ